ncbi:hypothetical protein [Pseudomonas gingeri]|uniref:hypothetical protein n=1 Tax=Pseudomonas gingeri TaxID=117681 RepID=UPI00159FD8DA|nr:hypothetical protein [Pseudomonas gingeri]NVZ99265.1 hypothetical protein [Pseudomonas gingeri]NWA13310.1 hypothetical protein [Pseudomonas gingeri]NWA55571.1 hypothetical protein [Pseudomonas gingeri]NWA95575.1 hypothetical protein [Pseudomonas gingeri]NWB00662.1 hypothetical protein [Pseudomonas gingeri]
MERLYTSPTLGEVLKYLVDASGILPRKARDREDDTEFDEVEAKSFRKRLERIAKEDCHLQKNMEEIIQLHAKTLSRYIRCPFRATQITELLNDLYESYASMVKSIGTFLTKADTTRYFLTTYAVEGAVRALARDWIKYQGHIYASAHPPEAFWYLPTRDEHQAWFMPLDKVLSWAYDACGQTLATFHHPCGVDDPNDNLKRNERAARSWKKAKRPPSLPVLVKNLEDSFAAQAQAGKPVDQQLQNAIVTCAAIARITTCIALDARDAFGEPYLQELAGQIQLYAGWMNAEIDEYMRNLEEEIRERNIDDAREKVLLGTRMAPSFWGFFEAKRSAADELMTHYMDSKGAVSPEVIRWLDKRYGSYAAKVRQDVIARWQLDKPAGLEVYLDRALALKNKPSATVQEVDQLALQMKDNGLSERLPWLLHWLRGVIAYRAEDYTTAAPHYREAFLHAKYSAGETQYILVNQYLEVMAKTRQWLAFKQGAQWACYLGLSVRWLRDKEPTDENLRNTYGILGLSKVHYARL